MNQSKLHTLSTPANELAEIIHEANQCAKSLLTILDQERDALGAGDVAGIDDSGQRKADCVIQLEKLDQERLAICQAMDISDVDIEGFLSQHSPTNTPISWQKFLTTLEHCRDANTVNGKIALLRRRHVEQALLVLRGATRENSGLYGPNGFDAVNEVSSLGQA